MYNNFIRFLSNGGDKINKTETDKRQRNREGERERRREREEGERKREREIVFSKHGKKEKQDKEEEYFLLLYLPCISSRLKFMKSYFLVLLFLFKSVFALLGFYV